MGLKLAIVCMLTMASGLLMSSGPQTAGAPKSTGALSSRVASMASSAKQGATKGVNGIIDAPGYLAKVAIGKNKAGEYTYDGKFITGKTGSLRSATGYDTYRWSNPEAVEGGWNFTTLANKNYKKPISTDMKNKGLDFNEKGTPIYKSTAKPGDSSIMNQQIGSSKSANIFVDNSPTLTSDKLDLEPVENGQAESIQQPTARQTKTNLGNYLLNIEGLSQPKQSQAIKAKVISSKSFEPSQQSSPLQSDQQTMNIASESQYLSPSETATGSKNFETSFAPKNKPVVEQPAQKTLSKNQKNKIKKSERAKQLTEKQRQQREMLQPKKLKISNSTEENLPESVQQPAQETVIPFDFNGYNASHTIIYPDNTNYTAERTFEEQYKTESIIPLATFTVGRESKNPLKSSQRTKMSPQQRLLQNTETKQIATTAPKNAATIYNETRNSFAHIEPQTVAQHSVNSGNAPQLYKNTKVNLTSRNDSQSPNGVASSSILDYQIGDQTDTILVG